MTAHSSSGRNTALPRLRVVLATDSLDPSGVGEHMLTLGRELASQYDVTLAFSSSQSSVSLLTRALRAGLAAKSIETSDAYEITRWLASTAFDLLHVHAGIGWEGHGLSAAGQSAGLPVVRTEHLPFLLTDLDQIAHYHEELKAVDRLIAVSDASAKSYRDAGVAVPKLRTVKNGITAKKPNITRKQTRAALGLARSDVMVLTVARFTPQKGHATLIAALPEIIAHHPHVHFVLVGEGPEQAEIERLAQLSGHGDRVRFLGNRDDVPDLLAAADLFVLPSLFEGLPLAILEAMAASLPIVASRIGGVCEAIGDDHQFLVSPGDPAELVRAIDIALADPSAATSVGMTSQTRFQDYHQASRMADQTAGIYADLGVSEKNQFERAVMNKVRIGFIGVGGIAHRHLGVLEQFDDVVLAAFADPDLGRAEEAAQRFGARAFSSHEDMLAGGDIDAVYICVPPFAHGDVEQAVISRGLPFFVEKPISLDIEIAERIAKQVESENIITAVGYHWRYLDTVDEARNILAGNPAQLISGYWLDSTPPPQWWWKMGGSGGQIVEQTTHILDLARYLVGDVTQVFGLAGHTERGDFPGLDVPTVSTASLKFASGAVGNIGSTCLLHWSHRVGLHIFGDGLAIELTDHDLMVDVGAGRPYRHAEGDPVWREDRDFIDAVLGRENHIRCSYGEALKTHRLALAITQSVQSGQPVTIAAQAQELLNV